MCGFLIDGCESLPKDATLRGLFGRIFENGDLNYAVYRENGGLKRARYSDMRAYSAALAARIDDLIPKGIEIVGLHMPNSPAWVLFFWALLMTGRVPLLLDSRMGISHFSDILSENGVEYVVTRDSFANAVSPDKLLSGLCRGDDAVFYDRWANGVIFLTSGTSGREKLVLYSGQKLVNQIQASRSMYSENTEIMYPPQHGPLRQLALMPFSHMFGFMICVIWYPYFGKEIVFPDSLSPDAVMKICRDARVTHIFASPVVFRRLSREAEKIANDAFGVNGDRCVSRIRGGENIVPKDLARVSVKIRRNLLGMQIRCLISGGASASEEDAVFFNRLGYRFVNGYGLTELGILAVETSDDPETLKCCFAGKPMHGVSASVDESGELIVRCAYAAVGYIENGALRPLEAPFRTGDLAAILPDGRLKLNGRRDDMMMLESGDRVHPADIEREFSNIKNVARVCVVLDSGAPALVVMASDMSEAALRETAERVSERNAYLMPRHRVYRAYAVSDMPISPKGDVNRSEVSKNLSSYASLALDETDASGALSALSARVANVFASVLNIDARYIRENADFFAELGGDSLLYATLAATVESEFGFSLPASEYSNLTTIARCARVINKYGRNA